LLGEITLPKKLWWYEIKTSYTWQLNQNEKWFAIELSSENNLAIVVKIDENGDLVVFDKQWYYTLNDFSDEILDEWTESDNPYVNLINRAIKSLWYTQLNKWDSEILWAAINLLTLNNPYENK
jgi:hypothetical protein